MNIFQLGQEVFDQLLTDYKAEHIGTLSELDEAKFSLISEYAYDNSNTEQEEDTMYDQLIDIVDELIINSDLNNLPDTDDTDLNPDYGV